MKPSFPSNSGVTQRSPAGEGEGEEWVAGWLRLVERGVVIAVLGGAFECGDLLFETPPENADV